MVPEIITGNRARALEPPPAQQRGLGVERVEDGLDHEDVGAAVDQALDGFAVGVAQLVEADVAEARIVHVRADRGGAAGGAEHPARSAACRGGCGHASQVRAAPALFNSYTRCSR
jgi:hypothetical protein